MLVAAQQTLAPDKRFCDDWRWRTNRVEVAHKSRPIGFAKRDCK